MNTFLRFIAIVLTLSFLPLSTQAKDRSCMWINVNSGEPVNFSALLDYLNHSDVIFLGERHTIDRHHEIQANIVDELGNKTQKLIVGFEQIEAKDQPILDQYNRGELTFEEFAKKIGWKKYWSNYNDYKAILGNTRRNKGWVIGLNAPRMLIRTVARKGLDNLSSQERAQLPENINTDDPEYSAHLKKIMMGMFAMMPGRFSKMNIKARLEKMVTAQICRDETMANNIYKYLENEKFKNYKAVIILGSGHCNYGFGTVQRLKRRMPKLKETVIVMSESGDLYKGTMKKKQKISRYKVNRPIADFINVKER